MKRTSFKRTPRSMRVIRTASPQQGIVLIDAMIAILIFSVGILGMVALQASAVEMTGSSNNRINAAVLANQVIAQMWASDLSSLPTNFQGGNSQGGNNQNGNSQGGSGGSGGTGYTNWFNTMDCTSNPHVENCLPGAKTNPPSIVITQQTIASSGNTQYQVTVTVYWKAPSDSSVHKYVSTTAIGK